MDYEKNPVMHNLRHVAALGVGPSKTRTTWLEELLRRGSPLHLPRKVKETYFFDKKFARGAVWYKKKFSVEDDASNKALCEVCPTYFGSQIALHNISNFTDAKVIITLRDPMSRTISHFWHGYSKGRYRSFQDALIKNPRIISDSYYHPIVTAWRSALGSDRVLVMNTDRFMRCPEDGIARLSQFLTVPIQGDVLNVSDRINVASAPRSRVLVKIARRVAEGMRNADMDALVEVGKKIGVKNMLKRERVLSDLDEVISDKEKVLIARVLSGVEGWEALCDV